VHSCGCSGVRFSNRILFLRRFRRFAVDLVDLDQREVALAVLGRADLALDGVAGVQVEAADLARADVDVVGAGQVRGVGRAQEAEAVGQVSSDAVAEDGSPFLAWFFSSAKISSCLRSRLAPSMPLATAISSSWLTCRALSSDRCMQAWGKKRKASGIAGVGALPRMTRTRRVERVFYPVCGILGGIGA
jgi:hypothetical protein